MESGEELYSESAEVLRMCDTHDRRLENMTSLIQAITAWIMGGRIQDEVADLPL